MRNEEIYRKKVCELCGAHAFEKHLGTAQVLDGGFTKIENFELSGFGSVVINYWDSTNIKDTRLEYRVCPDCMEAIDLAIHNTVESLKRSDDSGN